MFYITALYSYKILNNTCQMSIEFAKTTVLYKTSQVVSAKLDY